MKNSTKGVLHLIGVVIAATTIATTLALILAVPAAALNIAGVLFLMLGSLGYLVGMSMLGVDSILKSG